MEFTALSRKEQDRLRILRMRKKTTLGRKLAKCAVLQPDRREERRAREAEKERIVNLLLVRTGQSFSGGMSEQLKCRVRRTGYPATI